MRCNVGGTDRAVRIIIGVVLLVIAAAGVVKGVLAIAAVFVGAILLFTGVIRFCPISSALGISTCSGEGRAEAHPRR